MEGIGDEVWGGGGEGVCVSLSIGSQCVFRLMRSNWSAILSRVSAVCVVRWIGVTRLESISSRWCMALYIVVSLRWRSVEEGGVLCICGSKLCFDLFKTCRTNNCFVPFAYVEKVD